MTSGTALAPATTLARLRHARATADAAEVEVITHALEWADQHTVTDPGDAATWGDAPVPLAGEGAPQVSEFCVAEIAAVLGLSPDSGRRLVAHALELGHRLPRTWARVQDGAVAVERPVTLYVHLAPDSTDADVAVLENAGTHLLTTDQVRAWCGAAQVTVKPVIDLAEQISTAAYAIPDRLREQVVLRDRHCVFPWCERPARSCDLDHVEAYDADGPTSSSNLAPLCRRHHRVKTFGSWTYTVLEPGTFLWRSPHGYSFLRDATGTRDLTPRPVDPPG